MDISRRRFLTLAVPSLIVAPEIVRAYFLPPRGGWHQSHGFVSIAYLPTLQGADYAEHIRIAQGYTVKFEEPLLFYAGDGRVLTPVDVYPCAK